MQKLSLVLRGAGTATVRYGNLYSMEGGVVKLYLNGQERGKARYREMKTSFAFLDGDVLEITEEHIGVIAIYSIVFDCIRS